MVAPAWLPLPPKAYGGIEYVVHYLTTELRKLGVKVELFTVAGSTTPNDGLHAYYKEPQYAHIHRPLYESEYIPIAQVMFALNQIRLDGQFDIIHDHNGFTGPAMMAQLDPRYYPPALHTLHGPPFSTEQQIKETGLPDNRPMWRQLGTSKSLFIAPISAALVKDAPKELKSRIVKPVHNAVAAEEFPFQPQKHDYFITLARFSTQKGQGLAARLCEDLGIKLRMMGIVADLTSPRDVLAELAKPDSRYKDIADFNYFKTEVLPYLDPGWIEYVGNFGGQRKLDLIANSKGLLFPIQWDEPFGLAVIEALACGTPVVAMNRGAMPEIIEHGVNGFLANSPDEFREYMKQVDQIDPAACRRSVEENFSARVMAEKYIERYREVIKQAR
jgi:glycosyltransferase involved in cell wall biosynthesis